MIAIASFLVDPAIREEIFDRAEQRLRAIGGVSEVERMPAGDPATFPALAIFDNGHEAEDGETGHSRYALMLTVEGYVETADGPDAHAELHALYAAVIASLITEPALGGLVETIDEGGMDVRVLTLAAQRRLTFTLDLRITFSTRRGDPANL